MPLGEAEQQRPSSERAADSDQPAACVGSRRRRRLASASRRPLTSAKPSSQPTCPPSAELSSRSGPGVPPNMLLCRRRPAGAARPVRPRGRGRCIRRSARARCCRSCRRPRGAGAAGVSSTSAGQAPPTSTIAPPPASSWRSACSAAARGRGDPQPGGGDPRDDRERDAHLRLEAEPHAHAREDQPAGAPVLERAHRAPHAPPRSRARAARRGCCGARSRPSSA